MISTLTLFNYDTFLIANRNNIIISRSRKPFEPGEVLIKLTVPDLIRSTKVMFCFFHVILFFYLAQNLFAFSDQFSKFDKHEQELLLCRECGADVADSNYIFSKSSPGSRKTSKQNLFGKKNVTVQTLVNPFGVKFDVITLEKARCDNIGPQQGADSWFPGYTWRVCACPHCGQHLGWTFQSTDKSNNDQKDHVHSFHGLILSNVLGENFTDSLIMIPKMYKM